MAVVVGVKVKMVVIVVVAMKMVVGAIVVVRIVGARVHMAVTAQVGRKERFGVTSMQRAWPGEGEGEDKGQHKKSVGKVERQGAAEQEGRCHGL